MAFSDIGEKIMFDGNPVIFIGMHRSGTSLLGRILEKTGFFLGVKKDPNNESVFFQRINRWLLSSSGGRWDNPDAVKFLLKCDAAMEEAEFLVQSILNSPRAIEYHGLKGYMMAMLRDEHRLLWGWKDPRNTFTLPLWLRIFPEAKVVFIERHGVDVAESLRVRSRSSLRATKNKREFYSRIGWLRNKRGGVLDSPRCTTLEGAFTLWREYQQEASRVQEAFPQTSFHRVRYEMLLSDPSEIIGDILNFCNVDIPQREIEAATHGLNPERAYSFMKNGELREFASMRQDVLSTFDYEERPFRESSA